MQKQQGFTLLELMIAITILATLMLFSNQSIQNGLKAKVKIQEQVEDMSSVRDALRVMEKDINLAMHYRDIEMEFKQAVQKSGSTTPQSPGVASGTSPGASSGSAGTSGASSGQAQAQQMMQASLNQWMAMDPKRRDPTTDFIGSNEEVHFVTMNAPRLSEDIPQADFIKVGYYLSDCKKPGETGHTSKCLLRSASPLVEGDITINGPASVLLENISEYKLRYIGVNKQEWVTDWNSKIGDAGTKGYFPETVEISLAITKGEGDKKKKVSMQIIAPVRFPNNPSPQTATTGAAGGMPTPGGTGP